MITGDPAVVFQQSRLLTEQEVREQLLVTALPARQPIVDAVKRSFDYIDRRFRGNGQEIYDCQQEYVLFGLVRMFDPQRATECDLISADNLDLLALAVPNPSLVALIPQMKEEVAAYIAVANGVRMPTEDIAAYTEKILQFWSGREDKLPAFAHAARIVFALTPNSAGCERVFSLLATLFPFERTSSMSDLIEGTLMMRYNKRDAPI